MGGSHKDDKKQVVWRVSVKQLILPLRNLTGRILTYCFETAASKAPSDEGAVTEGD